MQRQPLELTPLPLGDISPLLEWFTEAEVKTLIGSQMTQPEVNMFVMACRRSTPRGIKTFKTLEWRNRHALRETR